MKVALAQVSPCPGDFTTNLQKISDALNKARGSGCDLALFPELALCGPLHLDLLTRASFLEAHEKAQGELAGLTKQFSDLICVVGALEQNEQDRRLFNSALVLRNGIVIERARKQRLERGLAFDEARFFTAGHAPSIFACGPFYCGLTLGADIWPDSAGKHPFIDSFMLGLIAPDLFMNIAASPFERARPLARCRHFSELCKHYQTPLFYANQAGGLGRFIYDGHSLAMDSAGTIRARGAGFTEDVLIVDFPFNGASALQEPDENIEELAQALICGIKDYAHNNGFTKVLLGLSGGIDSALVATLACLALGPENVLSVALPSPYTSELSINDARQLTENLGCEFISIPVKPAMDVYAAMLAPYFTEKAGDAAEQNIQARTRGLLLMALANRQNRLLLATGNKSELSVGYCTLYGDMCGGLAPLADVYKTDVYALARWCNRKNRIIPESTITRPPTAELKPNQRDDDDLPPYDKLDPILRAYVEHAKGVSEIARALHVDVALVRDITKRVQRNVYKRAQAAPGIKVSPRPYGPDDGFALTQGQKDFF